MTTDELEHFCAGAYPELVGAFTHHFGDRWLAEDLAQDALVRLCDHWGKVGQLSSPIGWAFRVGVNLGNSWFRRQAAERRARQRHGPVPSTHVDRDVADHLTVSRALQTLTAQQREAVVLRYFLGLDVEQSAAVLGVSPGAVRGLTHRAIQHLRTTLGPQLAHEETSDVS